MPAVLPIKLQDVDSPQKRAQFQICVLGCGLKGLFCALGFADAGFKVVCTDADQSVVKRLSKGNVQLKDRQLETKFKGYLRKEQVSATSDLSTAVSTSDIIIITLSPKVDDKKTVQTSEVLSACKHVGAALQRDSLVVYCGVGGIGFTENILKEKIENTSGLKAGEGFGLAYYPTVPAASFSEFIEREGVVASNDKYSQTSAAAIFGCITSKGAKGVFGIRLAEAATLFAAAKRDVDLALKNELTMLCENAQLDYPEAQRILTSAPLNPESGIAGAMNFDETDILLDNAETFNVKLRMPTVARQINEDIIKHAFNITQNALRAGGGTMRRAKIALLGETESQASATFIQLLEAKGATVCRYNPNRTDSASATSDSSEETSMKKTLNEAVEGADCLVLFSVQESLKRLNLKKLRALMKASALFVDLAGAVEPQKVEAEGFIYRGLGRGVYKK